MIFGQVGIYTDIRLRKEIYFGFTAFFTFFSRTELHMADSVPNFNRD